MKKTYTTLSKSNRKQTQKEDTPKTQIHSRSLFWLALYLKGYRCQLGKMQFYLAMHGWACKTIFKCNTVIYTIKTSIFQMIVRNGMTFPKIKMPWTIVDDFGTNRDKVWNLSEQNVNTGSYFTTCIYMYSISNKI